MRADRLLTILMLLQTKGRMTAHDLAEQLEVSERTIYRDLEALGIAGIPIYTERGPGGGCSLMGGYQTRLTGLTESEVRALFLFSLAARTNPLADLGLSKALDDALLKLSAALPEMFRVDAAQASQRFHLDATWWYHNAGTPDCLPTIQEALWRDRKLHLVYCADDGAWQELLVEPYGLVAKAGTWYLVSACNGEKVVLRVARLYHAAMTDEPFTRPADFDLASYWSNYCAQLEANRPPYSVPLRLAPDEARMLPQMLSEWGYMLVEGDNDLEADEPLEPTSREEEKKETAAQRDGAGRTFFPQAASGNRAHSYHQKEKTLFVLSGAGEWRPVTRRREEKKQISMPGESGTKLAASQKKFKIMGTRSKKTPPSSSKKTYWAREKKRVVSHIKKTGFPDNENRRSRPIKKTLYYSPAPTSNVLCA
jgi:predicted DNA-binding transcriptional regulator YafY